MRFLLQKLQYGGLKIIMPNPHAIHTYILKKKSSFYPHTVSCALIKICDINLEGGTSYCTSLKLNSTRLASSTSDSWPAVAQKCALKQSANKGLQADLWILLAATYANLVVTRQYNEASFGTFVAVQPSLTTELSPNQLFILSNQRWRL